MLDKVQEKIPEKRQQVQAKERTHGLIPIDQQPLVVKEMIQKPPIAAEQLQKEQETSKEPVPTVGQSEAKTGKPQTPTLNLMTERFEKTEKTEPTERTNSSRNYLQNISKMNSHVPSSNSPALPIGSYQSHPYGHAPSPLQQPQPHFPGADSYGSHREMANSQHQQQSVMFSQQNPEVIMPGMQCMPGMQYMVRQGAMLPPTPQQSAAIRQTMMMPSRFSSQMPTYQQHPQQQQQQPGFVQHEQQQYSILPPLLQRFPQMVQVRFPQPMPIQRMMPPSMPQPGMPQPGMPQEMPTDAVARPPMHVGEPAQRLQFVPRAQRSDIVYYDPLKAGNDVGDKASQATKPKAKNVLAILDPSTGQNVLETLEMS